MLKHFLVPEADRVLVSETAARAGTQAVFEARGMTPEDAALSTGNGEPITERVDAPDYGKLFMPPCGGTRANGSHKGSGFAMIADIRAEGIPYHREVVDWFNGASVEPNLSLRRP